MEDVEHGETKFSELTNDDPESEGKVGYNWNSMDVGKPIRGRTKKIHDSADKIYEMFSEHEEIGEHFTRSGSPGGAEHVEAEEE